MSELRVVPGVSGTSNLCKHIARYNAALGYCTNKRVLDAACGVGYGSWLLALVAKEVVGWDIDSSVIDQARSNYGTANSAFYPVDLMSIGDKRQVGATSDFDVVVSLETLEHVDNPEQVLTTFYELIGPGGLLVASVPLNEVPGANEHHKHTYTLASARELFKDFRPVTELVQHGMSFYPVELADQFPDDPVYYLTAGLRL